MHATIPGELLRRWTGGGSREPLALSIAGKSFVSTGAVLWRCLLLLLSVNHIKEILRQSLLLNFSCKTLLPNFHVLIEILFSYVLVWFIVWLFALHVQGVSKVHSDFLFAQISLIILKIFFLKLSMLFIIHLTLNN